MRNLQTGQWHDFRVQAFRVDDPRTGAPLCMASVQRDITASKRAQEEREKLIALVENSADFIGMATLEGKPFYANKAGRELLGLDQSLDLDAENILDYFDPETAALLKNTGIPTSFAAGQWAGEGNVRNAKTSELTPMHIHLFLVRNFETQEPICLATVQRNISDLKDAEKKLEKAHTELLNLSRLSGMAEVATSVLHNVGNVLNSVNVSTGLVVESVKHSRASSLTRVVELLQEHAHDLGTFITQDSRGQHVPAHLAQLAEHLRFEQEANVRELGLLRRNVDHIKEIVAMQQSYASFGGVKEMVSVAHLVEDSLRINEGGMNRHEVEVIREFQEVPLLNVEKHKVLQILVNLLRNAKHACDDSGRTDKRLTVRVANGNGRVKISVIDNGIGIPPENLTRIFNHGFTTRKHGHGFGLHSAALAANEMGGSLTVQSEGAGKGAAFTLELPLPDTARPA